MDFVCVTISSTRPQKKVEAASKNEAATHERRKKPRTHFLSSNSVID